MLIPSIDLMGGKIVQLVQGDRLAIRDDDIFKWVRRFERFPRVQVIDLDAARAASARPPVKTSTKCSSVPAPPDAMTGIDTA